MDMTGGQSHFFSTLRLVGGNSLQRPAADAERKDNHDFVGMWGIWEFDHMDATEITVPDLSLIHI